MKDTAIYVVHLHLRSMMEITVTCKNINIPYDIVESEKYELIKQFYC